MGCSTSGGKSRVLFQTKCRSWKTILDSSQRPTSLKERLPVQRPQKWTAKYRLAQRKHLHGAIIDIQVISVASQRHGRSTGKLFLKISTSAHQMSEQDPIRGCQLHPRSVRGRQVGLRTQRMWVRVPIHGCRLPLKLVQDLVHGPPPQQTLGRFLPAAKAPLMAFVRSTKTVSYRISISLPMLTMLSRRLLFRGLLHLAQDGCLLRREEQH